MTAEHRGARRTLHTGSVVRASRPALPAHLQHLGTVTQHGIVEDSLSFVVGDIHLGVAELHQLHQDLPVALPAGQVQRGAALLSLLAVGTAAGVGKAQVTGVLRTQVQKKG